MHINKQALASGAKRFVIGYLVILRVWLRILLASASIGLGLLLYLDFQQPGFIRSLLQLP
jgi:hypothetical protein